ncbi:hypothetical protein ASG92_26555 [Arthrobacter sp. Soil736]|uniref:hypothetical protein n=1 Tax=Arthrobacter sp. Soil736 TaxID=1736395 RepID=UPI0006FAAB42|nr:hypothetical protein [Arthrobacter sp. Soil736]KRE49516.1 hypothetical protein ASG92_26555 [Arthrobacter sp. Soil736]
MDDTLAGRTANGSDAAITPANEPVGPCPVLQREASQSDDGGSNVYPAMEYCLAATVLLDTPAASLLEPGDNNRQVHENKPANQTAKAGTP